MELIEITPTEFDVDIALAYSTPDNFTETPIYKNSICYLHPVASQALRLAVDAAKALGYRIKVFDALRPSEAQWALWNHTPDPNFLANPKRGSPHSRGIAIDLTLLDGTGKELKMGTKFDAFTPLSHHGNSSISTEAQLNRLILLGLMTQAGWDFYKNEWWHYQLFNSKNWPILNDKSERTNLI